MIEATALKGGHLNALARHAAAAYTNADSGDIDYDLSTGEVVGRVPGGSGRRDARFRDMFEGLQRTGVPALARRLCRSAYPREANRPCRRSPGSGWWVQGAKRPAPKE